MQAHSAPGTRCALWTPRYGKNLYYAKYGINFRSGEKAADDLKKLFF